MILLIILLVIFQVAQAIYFVYYIKKQTSVAKQPTTVTESGRSMFSVLYGNP